MPATILALPFLGVYAFCQIWAALSDARTMLIPNWISLVIIASFLIAAPLVGMEMAEFLDHMKSGFGVFAVVFVGFAFNLYGGGDAKLLAATAFWFTPPELIFYIAYAGMAGGVLAIGVLIGRKYLPPKILTAEWTFKIFNSGKNIPYGIGLAAGALYALPKTSIYARILGV